MENYFSFGTLMSAVLFMYSICSVSDSFESAVFENCRHEITEVTILFFSITQMIHDFESFLSLYMWIIFLNINKNRNYSVSGLYNIYTSAFLTLY